MGETTDTSSASVPTSADPPRIWPSSGWAWFAVAALMVAYTSSFIDRQILSLLVQPIRADLGITDTQFSLLSGLAFTLGDGNELVCAAIAYYAQHLVGRDIEELMSDFGSLQRMLSNHHQYRWLGPHKGVVQLDGQMVERLHAEMARRTIAIADAIAALKAG